MEGRYEINDDSVNRIRRVRISGTAPTRPALHYARDAGWQARLAMGRGRSVLREATHSRCRHECTLTPVSRLDIGIMERITQDNMNENARARLSMLTLMSAPGERNRCNRVPAFGFARMQLSP